jgi:hypothetical protein
MLDVWSSATAPTRRRDDVAYEAAWTACAASARAHSLEFVGSAAGRLPSLAMFVVVMVVPQNCRSARTVV